jgi:DNA primase
MTTTQVVERIAKKQDALFAKWSALTKAKEVGRTYSEDELALVEQDMCFWTLQSNAARLFLANGDGYVDSLSASEAEKVDLKIIQELRECTDFKVLAILHKEVSTLHGKLCCAKSLNENLAKENDALKEQLISAKNTLSIIRTLVYNND